MIQGSLCRAPRKPEWNTIASSTVAALVRRFSRPVVRSLNRMNGILTLSLTEQF